MAYQNKWQKKEVVRVKPDFNYPPSAEQADMFDFLRFDTGNLHGEAGAGTGKSTTMTRALHMDFMKKYRCAVMAFMKSIQEELEPKMPVGTDTKTSHAFAYGALAKKFGKPTLPDERKGEASKTEIILANVMPEFDPSNARGAMRGDIKVIMYNLNKLFSMVKATLADWNNEEVINNLMDRYGIDFTVNDEGSKKQRNYWEDIKPNFSQMMDKQLEITDTIDFSDMIWLPIMYDLKLPQYDMLFCDEWQDASPMMLELAARMVGDGRVMTIGDRFQSIMGFAGADTNSIDNTIKKFNSTQLPLMTCYRCGHEIIKEVNKIMPTLRAYEGNPQGEVVTHYDPEEFKIEEVIDGSMILCRRNSGLVRPCFDLLKKGRKAIIKGKEIGEDLIRLIDNQHASTVNELKEAILAWKNEKQEGIQKRKRVSQEAIEMIEDQYSAVMAFAENYDTVAGVKNQIRNIFTNDKTPGVTLSSMHKAKGLEAEEVVIVQADKMRMVHDKMKPEDHQQEIHLEYVGKTRAKKKLTMVWS